MNLLEMIRVTQGLAVKIFERFLMQTFSDILCNASE